MTCYYTSGNHQHDCSSHQVTSSVCQTLGELDFERGIWYPALSGDSEGVNKFLDKGIDPNVTDSSGYTALHYAGRNGHYKICNLLLEKGASVDYQTKSGRATPLHRAAYMGHGDIVKLLLSHRADPSITDSDNNTPVHKAVKQGHLKVAKLMTEKSPQLSYLLQPPTSTDKT